MNENQKDRSHCNGIYISKHGLAAFLKMHLNYKGTQRVERGIQLFSKIGNQADGKSSVVKDRFR